MTKEDISIVIICIILAIQWYYIIDTRKELSSSLKVIHNLCKEFHIQIKNNTESLAKLVGIKVRW